MQLFPLFGETNCFLKVGWVTCVGLLFKFMMEVGVFVELVMLAEVVRFVTLVEFTGCVG